MKNLYVIFTTLQIYNIKFFLIIKPFSNHKTFPLGHFLICTSNEFFPPSLKSILVFISLVLLNFHKSFLHFNHDKVERLWLFNWLSNLIVPSF